MASSTWNVFGERFGKQAKTRGQAPRRKRAASRPYALESLEPRQLLSTTPADVYDRGSGSYPDAFHIPQSDAGVPQAGEHAFFIASNAQYGNELWVTDGSGASTSLVADFTPGEAGSSITSFTDLGGSTFFVTQPESEWGASGTTLWRASPTGDVLEAVADNVYPAEYEQSYGVLNNEFFFFREGSTGSELWKSDADGQTSFLKTLDGGYSQKNFTELNGALYFVADNGTSGSELWKTNGTASGTVLVHDVRPGAVGSYPDIKGVHQGSLIFSASDDAGSWLWKANASGVSAIAYGGIADPYDVISVNNALFVTTSSSDGFSFNLKRIDNPLSDNPLVHFYYNVGYIGWQFAVIGNYLYFTGDSTHSGNTEIEWSGDEVWRADATSAIPEAELVRNIAAPFATEAFTNDESVAPITAESEYNDDPWNADDLRGSFEVVGNFDPNNTSPADHYASAEIAGTFDGFGSESGDYYRVHVPRGYELVIQGDSINRFEVEDANLKRYDVDYSRRNYYAPRFISPKTQDYYIRLSGAAGTAYSARFEVSLADPDANAEQFTVVGNTLFFTATSPAGGTELWRTTPAGGAEQVADLAAGSDSSWPHSLTEVDNQLYFMANGFELWKAGETGQATKLHTIGNGVDDEGSGGYGAMAILMTSDTDKNLLFAADDGETGYELWKHEVQGSQQTLLIADINTADVNNDSFSDATYVGSLAGLKALTNLTIHNADDADFFKFSMSAEAATNGYIEVRFPSREGDLDAYLIDANQNIINRAETSTDNEYISLTGLEAGDYYLAVVGWAGATNWYALYFETDIVGLGDRYEPNNTVDAPTVLGVVEGELRLDDLSIHVANDKDFFEITLAERGTADHWIDVEYDRNLGELHQLLLDHTGNAVAWASSVLQGDRISLNGLVAGTYTLLVEGSLGATNDYSIKGNLPVAGFSPDVFEPNDTPATATPIVVGAADSLHNLTIHDADDVDWFEFSLSAEGKADHYIQAAFASTQGDLDVALFDEQGDEVALSDGTDDEERLSLAGLAAGTYRLKVFGWRGATNEYALSWSGPRGWGDRFEPNNTLETAADLGVLQGDVVIDDLVFGPSNAATDVYKFTVTEPLTSQHSVTFEGFGGNGYGEAATQFWIDLHRETSPGNFQLLTSLDMSEQPLSLHWAAAENESPAGEYFVRLITDGSLTFDRYTLSFSLPGTSADRFEENETQDSAADLGALTGSVVFENLTLHSRNDHDWYTFTLPGVGEAGNSLAVIPEQGWLDQIEMWGPTGRIAFGDDQSDAPHTLDLAGLPAGVYTMHVAADGLAAARYRIEADGPIGIAADAYEPNNEFHKAWDLGTVRGSYAIAATIHEVADADFFAFTTVEDGTSAHKLDVVFDQFGADLDVVLYDEAGKFVGRDDAIGDNATIGLDGLAAGTYVVRIFSSSGVNEYDLVFSAPEPIVEDRYEENDSLETAYPLRTRASSSAASGTLAGFLRVEDINIHNSTDVDYFVFRTRETGTSAHVVDVLFSHADGDLDAYLLNASGDPVDSSLSATDNEQLSLQGQPAGTYYVVVQGNNGARNEYQLAFEAPAAPRPDAYEPNDTRDESHDNADLGVVTGDVTFENLSIHTASDVDYFTFLAWEAPYLGNESHYVDIVFNHLNGDLDAAIYDAHNSLVVLAESGTDNERLSLKGLMGGETYYLKVWGYDGAYNDYSIRFHAPSAVGADRFEENDTPQTATDLRVLTGLTTYADLSIHYAQDMDWFVFETVDTAAGHTIDISFLQSVLDIDAKVWNADGDIVAYGESETDNERIDLTGLPAGVYTLAVYAYDGRLGEYSLAFDLPDAPAGLPPDRYEENDTLQTASDLKVVEGRLEIDGLTIHNALDEDHFVFTTTSVGSVGDDIQVLFDHAEGDLDIALFTYSDGQLVGYSVSASSNEAISLEGLAAGKYMLLVGGYDGATNEYDLVINAPVASLPDDRFEPNNVTSAATDLRAIVGAAEVGDLTITANDVDIFTFQLVGTGTESDFVEAIFQGDTGEAGAGNLDLALVGVDQAISRESTSNSDNERISLEGLPPGEYQLVVSGRDGTRQNEYSLKFRAPEAAPLHAWTIMVYMSASNLGRFAQKDLNEIETALSGLPGSVNFTVFLDQSSADYHFATGGGSQEAWGTAGRAVMQADNDPSVVSTSFELLGEQNSGAADTLSEFITWSEDVAPAERYALVLWDHGTALEGFIYDDSDTGEVSDHLDVDKLYSALVNSSSIDVLGFDACLMAMAEIALRTQDFVGSYVAAQPVIAGNGWDYTTLFSALAASPYDVTLSDVVTGMVDSFSDYYGTQRDDTLSAIVSDRLGDVWQQLRVFTDLAKNATQEQRRAMRRARAASYYPQAQGSSLPYYRDLGDFMANVASNPAAGPQLRSAAADVQTAIENAVVAKVDDRHDTTGLSVFMPALGDPVPAWYRSQYESFCTETGWADFLDGFVSRTTEAEVDWVGGTNQNASRAYNLGLLGGASELLNLSLLELDEEWFRFETDGAAGAANTVTATDTDGERSFTLEVFSVNGSTLLRSSGAGENFVSLDGLPAGEYAIKIVADGVVANYTLAFDLPELGDVSVGNSSSTKATDWGLVAAGSRTSGVAGTVASGAASDEGWAYFEFDTPRVDPVPMTMTFASGPQGSLDIELIGADGSLLVNQTGTSTFDVPLNVSTPAESFSLRVRQTPTKSGADQTASSFAVSFSNANQAPTGVTLSPATFSLPERTSTSTRIKLADIVIEDDGLGENTISLLHFGLNDDGSTADLYEVVGTSLYLKAGVTLDASKSDGYYTVQVTVQDLAFADVADALFELEVTASPTIESVLTFGSDGYWRLANSDGSSFTQSTFAYWSTAVEWDAVLQGDFNGDGLQDVAGRTHIGQWWSSINQGDGTAAAPDFMIYWKPSLNITEYVSGDFNGDGRTDVAGISSNGVWWAGLARTDTIGFTNTRMGAWSSSLTFTSIQTGDFDGDGRTDIAGLTSTGQWFGLIGGTGGKWQTVNLGYWSPTLNFTDAIVTGDFNGDGKTDIAGRTEAGQWWAAIANTDTVGFTNALIGGWSTAVSWSSVSVGDFNGDGQADIIARASNGQWWGLVSDGTAGLRTNTHIGYWNPNVVWTGIITGDADGDGRDDLIGRVATTYETARGRLWVAKIRDGALMQTTKWGFQTAAEEVSARDIFFSTF